MRPETACLNNDENPHHLCSCLETRNAFTHTYTHIPVPLSTHTFFQIVFEVLKSLNPNLSPSFGFPLPLCICILLTYRFCVGCYGTQKAGVIPMTCKDGLSQELLLLALDGRHEHRVSQGRRGWLTVSPWAGAAPSAVTELSQLLKDG